MPIWVPGSLPSIYILCSKTEEFLFYPTLTVNEQWTESDFGGPDGSAVKNPPANAGDTGLIPGLGRSPGGGNDNPFQYSCLENSMGRRAWHVTDHGIICMHNLATKHTHHLHDKRPDRTFHLSVLILRVTFGWPQENRPSGQVSFGKLFWSTKMNLKVYKYINMKKINAACNYFMNSILIFFIFSLFLNVYWTNIVHLVINLHPLAPGVPLSLSHVGGQCIPRN